MRLSRPALLIAAAVTVLPAATAAARPFVVSKAGNHPAVAVDAAGTAHVTWDSVSGDTSTTHYCRVVRNGTSCAKGTERRFAPAEGDQDFAGPRVFLAGGRRVVVVTARCCSSSQGPDGQFHATRVFAITSQDGGATFGAPAWIGTQPADVGAALSGETFLALGVTGSGTGVQGAPLGGFAGAENTVTPQLAVSGGIGDSATGGLIAFATGAGELYAATFAGDVDGISPAFKKFGKGSDVVVAGGRRAVDLFWRTTGGRARYVTRRYVAGRPGKVSAVSESGFPIFGTAVQDAAGRLHAAWQGDRGLTYRRSARSGRGFAPPRRLSRRSGYYNLQVGANAQGRATVVYDTNGFAGRVGGFTAG